MEYFPQFNTDLCNILPNDDLINPCAFGEVNGEGFVMFECPQYNLMQFTSNDDSMFISSSYSPKESRSTINENFNMVDSSERSIISSPSRTEESNESLSQSESKDNDSRQGSTRDNSDANAFSDCDERDDSDFDVLSTKTKTSRKQPVPPKKYRAPKKDRKHYLLENSDEFILGNTIIKKLFDTLSEEGACTFQRLVELYAGKKDELRRTDGTCYSGDPERTVRGTLEANPFFQLLDKKGKLDKDSQWIVADEALSTKFFEEQKNAIKVHKLKYKKPLKKAISKDSSKATRQRANKH